MTALQHADEIVKILLATHSINEAWVYASERQTHWEEKNKTLLADIWELVYEELNELRVEMTMGQDEILVGYVESGKFNRIAMCARSSVGQIQSIFNRLQAGMVPRLVGLN